MTPAAMLAGLVGTHPAARRAWPWLPALVRAGRIFVGPTGEVLVAYADGTLAVVIQGGWPAPSVSANPCLAGRRG